MCPWGTGLKKKQHRMEPEHVIWKSRVLLPFYAAFS